VKMTSINEEECPLVSEQEEPADRRRQGGHPATIAGQPNDSGHYPPIVVDSSDPRASDAAY
jgi:hypothetical protein